MSAIFYIILLAAIQGITEFLPISSSGHLVLTKHLFGLNYTGAGMETALHAGTLISILAFYWRDICGLIKPIFGSEKQSRTKSIKYVAMVILGSVPIFLAGFFGGKYINDLFDNPPFASSMLIITGIILGSTYFATKKAGRITFPKSLYIGVAQAVALLPGISRSGGTISIARLFGVKPEDAARFSFILAIPALIGAIIFEAVEKPDGFQAIFLIGIIVAAIIGYISLRLLLGILKAGKFWIFAPYCIILGIAGLIFI